MSDNSLTSSVNEFHEVVNINLSQSHSEFCATGSADTSALPPSPSNFNTQGSSRKRKSCRLGRSPASRSPLKSVSPLKSNFDDLIKRMEAMELQHDILTRENRTLKKTVTSLQNVVADLKGRVVIIEKDNLVTMEEDHVVEVCKETVGSLGEIHREINAIKNQIGELEVIRDNLGGGMATDIANSDIKNTETWTQVPSRNSLNDKKMINTAASEMSDRTDRSRNIVISGLPFNNVTKECNHHSIIDSFLKDNNINVDFSINKKIYNKSKSGIINMVIIRVASAVLRDKILLDIKPRLKNKKIFFNVDKTPLELQIEYQLRQDMRKLILGLSDTDKNIIHYYIKNQKIYKVVKGSSSHVLVSEF